jgi:diguanylate cyclase (GGDEF)-like protein
MRANTRQTSIERAWVFQLQLAAERIFSPFRILAMVIALVAWYVVPHPPGSHGAAEWMILGAGALLAVINEIVLRSDLDIIRSYPYISVGLDLVIIGGANWGAGPRGSYFQEFIDLGLIAAALRLPLVPTLIVTPAYVALKMLFADSSSMLLDGIICAIIGFGIAAWRAEMTRRHESAIRDPLTAAYSREFGIVRLRDLIAQRRMPFSVAVIDVDNFKSVNDTYGHEVGDVVLRQTARVMAASLRVNDYLCRMGGDEFLIVFDGVAAEVATKLGDRLSNAVLADPAIPRDLNFQIPISISVGIAQASDGMTTSQLLKAADVAMYDAKRRKNSVRASAVS